MFLYGTAPIDLGECLFCHKSLTLGDTPLRVEMNVDVDGKFHAHQNHPEFDHQGAPIVAERVRGVAHVDCYKAWYERTYRSPFTMSA